MSQIQTPPAVALVDRLLRSAKDLGASDLHLDPGEDGVRVRIRKDGVLRDLETLDADTHGHLVGRFKALADLLVYRSELPQEGRIPAARSATGHDVRVATYPTMFGERIAVRVDATKKSLDRLEDLGFDGPTWKALRDAIEQPDGVVLVTGPSGSGKTTTLYACVRHIANRHQPRAVMTVEDPIEKRIPGVVQTQIAPAHGLDFSRALRSLLRQDPEVLLIGEIRDRETAHIALEAGLTGHLVTTTIHAGSAPLVFARLIELGVEPFVITSAVRGVLSQRLVRAVCQNSRCLQLGDQCPDCHGSGYSGRVPIAEWVPMTDELRKTILARGDGADLTAAATEAGAKSLEDAADVAIASRRTTLEEVRRVLGTR